jgi:hypothetical protein
MAKDLIRCPRPEADDAEPNGILYQHTILCQTGLPYRDPGSSVRRWQRSQGAAHLQIEAGSAFHPGLNTFVDVGLPFGPKPRLILAHLNAEALRTGAPTIYVEDSLTSFVHRLGLTRDGRTIRVVKDQLARLAASEIRLAVAYSDREARQVQAHLIGEFDLWLPKDERRRVMWPSTVTLDPRYFESLTRHAVPLDERTIGALAHSAMALDIYTWLAQRLHRVEPSRPAFIPWKAVKDQFGPDYDRMVEFRRVFRRTLELVLGHYRGARIELDQQGMTLRHSPPPVKGRIAAISRS